MPQIKNFDGKVASTAVIISVIFSYLSGVATGFALFGPNDSSYAHHYKQCEEALVQYNAEHQDGPIVCRSGTLEYINSGKCTCASKSYLSIELTWPYKYKRD